MKEPLADLFANYFLSAAQQTRANFIERKQNQSITYHTRVVVAFAATRKTIQYKAKHYHQHL